MGICVPFSQSFKYLDEVQELTIKYDSNKDKYLDLFTFVGDQPQENFRVNIELTQATIDYKAMSALNNVHPQIYLKLNAGCVPFINKLQENKLKYFFDMPVMGYDLLDSFAKAGVSDIYIANELCFNLDKVKGYLSSFNIKMRTYLNEVQKSDPFGNCEDIYSFFIRPEDFIFYNRYFDSLEFVYNDIKQLSTLYEIYVKKGLWFGDLKEIIKGLNESLPSNTLLPTFAVKRANCGKKCYLGSGCNICARTKTLSTTFVDNNKIFNYKENGE